VWSGGVLGDESAICSDYHRGTTWAPKGEMPVIKTTGARFSINLLSAISSKGYMRFIVTEERCIHRFSETVDIQTGEACIFDSRRVSGTQE
jgi:hypothetical protein